MKRGEPLRRNTPLGRGGTPLTRSKGPGRGNGRLARSQPQKRREPIPVEVRERARLRSSRCCVVCGWFVSREGELHHVLPVRLWPEFTTVEANLVLLCPGCHDEHERAHRRLSLAELPAETLAWLRSLPDGPIGVYIERTYTA